jgi:hypothetical protein
MTTNNYQTKDNIAARPRLHLPILKRRDAGILLSVIYLLN